MFNAPKIKDAKHEQILQSLAHIFFLIGLKDKPDKIETDIIINYITTTYNKYTILDIVEAFKRGISGEIKVKGKDGNYTSIDMNLYKEPFSCKYIGRVMSCYEEWRSCKILDLKKIEATEERKKNEVIASYTPESCAKSFNGLKNFIEKNKSLPISWDWIGCYYYMNSKGLISNESKKKFIPIADRLLDKEVVDKKKRKESYNEITSFIERYKKGTVAYQNFCRQELVKYHFNKKLPKS